LNEVQAIVASRTRPEQRLVLRRPRGGKLD